MISGHLLDAGRGNVIEEEKTCVYTGRQTPVEEAGRSRPEQSNVLAATHADIPENK